MEIGEALVGIDQKVAALLEALEYVDRLEQRHVLDDQGVRRVNRLTQPDFLGIDATERDHGRAHALGAKTWKGLRMLVLEERRDREDGRCRDYTLAATSMDADLEHRRNP